MIDATQYREIKFPAMRVYKLGELIGEGFAHVTVSVPLWIECKADNGKQSVLQALFQVQVEAEGHKYAIVRSIEDVQAALKG